MDGQIQAGWICGFCLREGFAMPNDARLGLVVGVTLVILVAVLFVRKDPIGGAAHHGAPAAPR